MAAGDSKRKLGTEIILETAASSAAMNDGDIRVLDSDDLQAADVAGKPLGLFEFDTAAGGFSAAPTAGAVIMIMERKINSDGNDAPVPASTYKHDVIGRFKVKPADEQQYLTAICPINEHGGKYYLEWLDGGSGTASIDAGWEARVTPFTMGPE